ncbi:MarR family winged helix-turn-helix transcriptional regulator [Nocardioides astragali]|uniref:MarR family winged helix-turn-helix transcriptional regulator n=1 Tax=Nocardioides astragali TaxID=1776736 RepID=A0ABW2MV87_9ACTN|nr:MarR family transcriptional regulator [Nocardioides astragali]
MVDETSTGDPQLNVGVLMYVAARSLEARAYDAVVAAGATDLTPTQARLMAQIDPHGSRVVTLAARARIAKQSAAFLVDQLERAGYVVRVADPRDGRAKLVRLSPRGRAFGDVADAEVARALQEWEQHVGAARMRDLEETMRMLRETTDPWA